LSRFKEDAAPKSGYRIPRFDIEEIRHSLRKLMWKRVGIIRCNKSLSEALKKMKEWAFILDKKFVTRRELELKNMLTLSALITESALLRKGSVGAHFRSDFPERDEGWGKHITVKKASKGMKYELIK